MESLHRVERSINGPDRKQCLGQDHCALWPGTLVPDAVIEHVMKGSLFRENRAARVGLLTFCSAAGFAVGIELDC